MFVCNSYKDMYECIEYKREEEEESWIRIEELNKKISSDLTMRVEEDKKDAAIMGWNCYSSVSSNIRVEYQFGDWIIYDFEPINEWMNMERRKSRDSSLCESCWMLLRIGLLL